MVDKELVRDLINNHGVSAHENAIGQTCVTNLNEGFIVDLIECGIEFEYGTPHFVIFIGKQGCEVSYNVEGLVFDFPSGRITIPRGCPDGKVTIAPF